MVDAEGAAMELPRGPKGCLKLVYDKPARSTHGIRGGSKQGTAMVGETRAIVEHTASSIESQNQSKNRRRRL